MVFEEYNISIMSNKEILEKAIQKAIDGGWKYRCWKQYNEGDIAFQKDNDPNEYFGWIHFNPIDLIFNPEFAKALWGNEYDAIVYVDDLVGEVAIPRDKYNLQQMVIAEDPIKYLGENL